jgi:hypothetical protein
MVRGCNRLLLSILTVLIGCGLTACVGKSSNPGGNGTVQSISLNPSTSISLEQGNTQAFSASAKNSIGQTLLVGISFVSDNNAVLTISTGGLACAGSWDSLSFPVVCTPGQPGTANVTAVSNGVSSAPVTVYVHPRIEGITISRIGTPQPDHGCFSQGESWNYQATVLGPNGTDITTLAGPVAWAGTNSNVLVANTTITGLLNNQVQITARTPGITPLFASVSGFTSPPVTYTTCLVQSVKVQIQGETGNSLQLNNGASKSMVATAIDTAGTTLTSPPLTWSTSDPVVASVSSTGAVSARQNLGSASISASCTPPNCNIGVLPSLPVYSTNGTLPNGGGAAWGTIGINVTATKPPTFTAWAATTGCGTNLNCTSVIFPVTSASNQAGSGTVLPFTPNSLFFTPAGSRAYLGSSKGLMFVDFGTNLTVSTVSQETNPCNVALCGKVLAISNDGTRVLIADTNAVYIFNSSLGTSVVLTNITAKAGAFSPDGLKVFIAGNNSRLYVYSTVDALTSVALPASANDVAFSSDSSFAYLADAPTGSVSGYSVCAPNNVPANVLNNVPSLGANPVVVHPLPAQQLDSTGQWVQPVLVLNPPTISTFGVTVTQPGLLPGQLTCQPPVVSYDSNFTHLTKDLGLGNFVPVGFRVVGDGTRAILAAENVGAILTYNVNGGTTGGDSLLNNGVPLVNAGAPAQPVAISPDGSVAFVSACEAFEPDGVTCTSGSIHIVQPQNGGDVLQVPYINANTNNSMCNNLDPNGPPCLPDLIAIKPL